MCLELHKQFNISTIGTLNIDTRKTHERIYIDRTNSSRLPLVPSHQLFSLYSSSFSLFSFLALFPSLSSSFSIDESIDTSVDHVRDGCLYLRQVLRDGEDEGVDVRNDCAECNKTSSLLSVVQGRKLGSRLVTSLR
jgi:hypothetical protein